MDGGDTLIGTGTYSANGTLTLALNTVVTNKANLLVVDNFSSGATVGATYQTGVALDTDISGVSGSGNAQFQGAPIQGASIRIVQATPTPVNSSTPTSTPTVTSSYTVTPSFTPTPILQTVVCPAYPNPSNGVPISFCVEVPGTSEVNMDVFTAAFRKVVSRSVQVTGETTLEWDLRDNWGKPVANGLYYVRVQVNGIQPTVKILKVLVIN